MNTSRGATRQKWIAFILCVASYLLCGTVATLMSVYLPVAVPELLKQQVSDARLGEVGAFIGAIFLYGWMLGGLLFGIISDRIGRKNALVAVTALYGIATLLTTWASSWYVLMAYRFVAGMGVGGVILLATVYLSEIWDERTKPIYLGILAVMFPVGIMVTGVSNVLFAEWRHAFWLGIIPLAIAVLMFWFLEESKQWEDSKKIERQQQPRLFDSQNSPNLLRGSVIFGAVLVGLWGIFSWLPTWVQTLLPAGQSGQEERGITMMLLGSGGIVGGMLSGFLIKALGTRHTLLLTFGGCTVISSVLFITNHEFGLIVYLQTALLALCFGISQGALSSYIPQLFPTSVRATASGFCFNVGRFVTATAVFFVGTLVGYLGGFGNALLAFSITFLVALLITFFTQKQGT